ncbi:hypothetical protein SEA_OCTOBIEN14_82 [Gordonia phage Octobien14]|uniref:DUF3310 domain-containing protein n=1 Tax=Gordonia phage Octobien14 TaxID=2483673 RepID=A0A3G3M9T6_9CAUD|nr:nucleotide kinase [Gordonia phage Octobien14]AYR03226.1 hypothetical protein SEA_OCTOBIEN14_82 [Gordonia phage Octobien14]
MSEFDPVAMPKHYNGFSSGAQPIDIARDLTFCGGNIVKYAARSTRLDNEHNKGDRVEDLRKVIQYAEFEIARLEGEQSRPKHAADPVEAYLDSQDDADAWEVDDDDDYCADDDDYGPADPAPVEVGPGEYFRVTRNNFHVGFPPYHPAEVGAVVKSVATQHGSHRFQYCEAMPANTIWVAPEHLEPYTPRVGDKIRVTPNGDDYHSVNTGAVGEIAKGADEDGDYLGSFAATDYTDYGMFGYVADPFTQWLRPEDFEPVLAP